MSDPTRRKFLGAAAALPFVDVPSDDSGDVSSSGESENRPFSPDSPPQEELSPERIGLTRPTVEDMRDVNDGHIAIRPIWEPENPQVAQVGVTAGALDITSSLGEEEVEQLIAELEHAKEIAAEYSKDES